MASSQRQGAMSQNRILLPRGATGPSLPVSFSVNL
jgi:hypothetical protein